jgi:hypothetical protein
VSGEKVAEGRKRTRHKRTIFKFESPGLSSHQYDWPMWEVDALMSYASSHCGLDFVSWVRVLGRSLGWHARAESDSDRLGR